MKTNMKLGMALLFLSLTSVGAVNAEESDSPIDTKTYANRLEDAFFDAKEQGKLLIAVFSGDPAYDGFSERFVKRMADPVFAKYSYRVIFCVTYDEQDVYGDSTARRLNVLRYPTIVILQQTPKATKVLGRMEGDGRVIAFDRMLFKAITMSPDEKFYPVSEPSAE